MQSLPARGAWIEISVGAHVVTTSQSLPARGAWIEMNTSHEQSANDTVAPRKGSVD